MRNTAARGQDFLAWPLRGESLIGLLDRLDEDTLARLDEPAHETRPELGELIDRVLDARHAGRRLDEPPAGFTERELLGACVALRYEDRRVVLAEMEQDPALDHAARALRRAVGLSVGPAGTASVALRANTRKEIRRSGPAFP